MLEFALAAVLMTWTPGPDDPVCEPGQTVEIDHCAQGQLPEETIGRVITDENGVNWEVIAIGVNGKPILQMVLPTPSATPTDIPSTAPVAEVGTVAEYPKGITKPKPPKVLAETGVKAGPCLLAGSGLVLTGGGFILLSRKKTA